MARFQVSSWAFVCICVSALFWVIALGGIAGVTSECLEGKFSSEQCSRGLQYEWFTVWFQLVLSVLLLSLGYSTNFHTYKPAMLAFLVLVPDSRMWSARSFMTVGSFPDIVGNFATKNAAAAGFVLLCISNFVLIWLVGTSEPLPQSFEPYPKTPSVAMSSPLPAV